MNHSCLSDRDRIISEKIRYSDLFGKHDILNYDITNTVDILRGSIIPTSIYNVRDVKTLHSKIELSETIVRSIALKMIALKNDVK